MATTVTVDVNLTDGLTHQLALYVVDWDSRGRAETIEIRDAATNALLDSQTVTGFVGGQILEVVGEGACDDSLHRAGAMPSSAGSSFTRSGSPNALSNILSENGLRHA